MCALFTAYPTGAALFGAMFTIFTVFAGLAIFGAGAGGGVGVYGSDQFVWPVKKLLRNLKPGCQLANNLSGQPAPVVEVLCSSSHFSISRVNRSIVSWWALVFLLQSSQLRTLEKIVYAGLEASA